ncbi:hypothetical protein MKW92_039019 [Papaver armeniacum]|nr:hypothetical protein MKW92_039019 [Papaver armeniacum]
MIYVDGIPFSTRSSQGTEDLIALLEHPFLVSASNKLKVIPVTKVSVMEGSRGKRSTPAKHVYVFQREYATVDPALVEVHIVGAFEDAVTNQTSGRSGSESESELYNHSIPLCSKIIEALQNKGNKFHIQTFCVLGHNTTRDSDGNVYPVFNGFMVETSSGSVRPASFDGSSRCPDEIVRRIRVTVSYSDPSWTGKLLETYDSHSDQYQIAPCSWNLRWKEYALSLQQLSDSDILLNCSTSPSAEGPDFVDNHRRLFDYLIQHPKWRETFPMRKPRIFKRTASGDWIKAE